MDGDQVGRGETIRTSGLYVPNVARYQAKLHPEKPLIHCAIPGLEGRRLCCAAARSQKDRSTDVALSSIRAFL